MLLTIHNLPSHMRYVDIKALLQTKCGLSEVILDNLVNEGVNKKVTVGLVEEEDAAMVVRHLNGLVMDGKMLYVEDVRQKKSSEQQPYRTSDMIANQYNQNMSNPWQSGQPPGYGYGMGYPPPMMQMDPSGMMMPPMMNGYFMPQNNYMGYNQGQQSSNMPQSSQPMDKNNQQDSRDFYNRGSNKPDGDTRSQWRRGGNNDSNGQEQYDEPGSRARYRSRSPVKDDSQDDSQDDSSQNYNYGNDNSRFQNNRRFDNSQNNNFSRSNNYDNDGYFDRNPKKNNPGRWGDHERSNDNKRYQSNAPSRYKFDRRWDAPQGTGGKQSFGKSKNAPSTSKQATGTAKNSSGQGQNQTSYEVLIRKCDAWKHQVSAKIKKDILTKFGYTNDDQDTVDIGKAVKIAIHTRLELILKGETVKMKHIEARYRAVFPESDDKEFFDAILENVRKEQLEKEKEPKEEKTESTSEVVTEQADSIDKTEPECLPPETAPKLQSNFAIPKTSKPKPQATEPSRLPKYPNSNKKAYTEQKKLQKLEFEDENLYQLDAPLAKALDEQLDKFCELFTKELQNPANEKEAFVCNQLQNISTNYFRKSLKVNITKRLLDIRTNLIVRVFIDGKIAKKADVCAFMKKFGVTSIKKSEGKKLLYVANFATYEDYDNVLTMGRVPMNDETVLSFKPFQLTGPKQKHKKKAPGETQAAFQKRLEEFKRSGGSSEPGDDLDHGDNNDGQDDEDYEMQGDEGDDDGAYSEDNVDDESKNDDEVDEVKDEDYEDY